MPTMASACAPHRRHCNMQYAWMSTELACVYALAATTASCETRVPAWLGICAGTMQTPYSALVRARASPVAALVWPTHRGRASPTVAVCASSCSPCTCAAFFSTAAAGRARRTGSAAPAGDTHLTHLRLRCAPAAWRMRHCPSRRRRAVRVRVRARACEQTARADERGLGGAEEGRHRKLRGACRSHGGTARPPASARCVGAAHGATPSSKCEPSDRRSCSPRASAPAGRCRGAARAVGPRRRARAGGVAPLAPALQWAVSPPPSASARPGVSSSRQAGTTWLGPTACRAGESAGASMSSSSQPISASG